MSTDWNTKKSHFTGHTLSWNDKDDIQRLLTIVQNDIVDALNTVFEYGYVLDFTLCQQDFVNKSPYFWAEVIEALRFSLVMKTARLFDETKDAIGLQKVFNILEQSLYRETLKNELLTCRDQYSNYCDYREEIKLLRDRLYAHNDKREYRFWNNPPKKDFELEGEFWGKLEEMLIWARDSILNMRILIGDGYPVNREIYNDLPNMVEG